MLHVIYIVAFAILAFIAVSNLIQNIMLLGSDVRRGSGRPYGDDPASRSNRPTPHPEMLDDTGRMVDEPLLVMKSIDIEDAREQLDALFENSTSASDSSPDDDN